MPEFLSTCSDFSYSSKMNSMNKLHKIHSEPKMCLSQYELPSYFYTYTVADIPPIGSRQYEDRRQTPIIPLGWLLRLSLANIALRS